MTHAVVQAARAAFDATRDDLVQLVRIPSISSSPDHRDSARACAEAVARLLGAAGLENVRLETIGDSPAYVVGDWLHCPGSPTVLLYAHHDVQPPGIVEHWTSDPWEPSERDGRLYGRGTADDKAGIVLHAAAVRAWLDATGALPCNVKILVEGEEEIGSPHLLAYLAANHEDLAADLIVLADTGMFDVGVPALTCSLRGIANVDVRVRALEGPVHSGTGGGLAPDPAMGLAKMLATLVDARGEIAFDGAHDGLEPPTPAERARMAALPAGVDIRALVGLLPGVEVVGDTSFTPYERGRLRPSLTVIGFDSHPIEGSSNQIVSEAAARISIRLGPGQDPDHVVSRLRSHLERVVPWGLELTATPVHGAPAWRCLPEGPAFDAARRAFSEAFGTEPPVVGEGGSIPFVGPFAEAYGGIPALLYGPADHHSATHGEDESVHLDTLLRLVEAEALLLDEVATALPGH